MSLEGRLISVRALARGSRVGYGGDWQAARDSVLGVIDVGYGDGYPWRLKSGTPVVVNGSRVPVVGRISMDLISVDLTDVPGSNVGDTALLWGADPDVAELAHRAGTSPYELLTGVGSRVRRICE
jgi:alanine racemase